MDDTENSLLELPAIVDLYNVEELLPTLLDEETLPHSIDISNIEKITTAGIQLFLSIALTAQKINTMVAIDITNNEAITSATKTLGINLSDYFNQETSS